MSDDDQPPPSTQVSTQSRRSYAWIFLFKYDPNSEFPFSCVSIKKLKGNDFPHHVISGHLGLGDRQKVRQLAGSKQCIFAKVEEGIYNKSVCTRENNVISKIFFYSQEQQQSVGKNKSLVWTNSTLNFFHKKNPFKNATRICARRSHTGCSKIGLMRIIPIYLIPGHNQSLPT